MEIKFLTSITSAPMSSRSCFVIGTSNHIFSSNDVVATAILCLLHKNDKEIYVLRSTNQEELKKCSICVGTGEGKFDHHSKFNIELKRARSTKHASAGLVWEEFGVQIVSDILTENNLTKYLPVCDMLVRSIDDNIIKFVDARENGTYFGQHNLDFIDAFFPTWYEYADFDTAFENALIVTIPTLERLIKRFIAGKIEWSW